MKLRNIIISLALTLFVGGALMAQPRMIDREEEAKEFPDLQKTEKIQDDNIIIANSRLQKFWYLVDMAKYDRQRLAAEYSEPLEFKNTFRQVKYTPRNTYIRYVQDVENTEKKKIKQADGKEIEKDVTSNYILAGFGDPKELKELLTKKVAAAKDVSKISTAKEVNFEGKRIGIELTQFEFIYSDDEERRKAVGSRRKSVALYFVPNPEGEKDPLHGEKLKLDMVVTKIVEDHLIHGVRYLQLIIDPTPNDAQLDDVIIYDRYNQKPTSISILGMMSNTPNHPHRLQFKQKFYIKHLNHFFRLYRLLEGYATRDGNNYNRELLEKVIKSGNDY